MTRRRLHGIWYGRCPYGPAREEQIRLHEMRRRGEVGDTVLLLEHDPVVTLGRGAHPENVLAPRALLASRGIDLVETERGGDVTLHAPGQLVCYPILDLAPDRADVRRYVNDLTETMRLFALDFEVEGGTVPGAVGLWADRVDPRRWPGPQSARDPVKLGAVGVRISRWVTMHGFALNLTVDLSLYRFIVPCGIADHGVTSLQDLVGAEPRTDEAAERTLALLAGVIDADVVSLERRTLPR